MKLNIIFAFLYMGNFCFAQNKQDSIAFEKRKQHKSALIDFIRVDDKAIFDYVINDNKFLIDGF